jgi:hypothetical protein
VNCKFNFPVESPEEFLPKILECLVFSFEYDDISSDFSLVIDFPSERPEVDREFLALEFLNVHDFQRVIGSFEPMRRFTTSYLLKRDRANIVVQAARCAPKQDGHALELWFGPAFGGISCLFERASARRREAKATRGDEGAFIYQDWNSGESFDFYDPFGAL